MHGHVGGLQKGGEDVSGRLSLKHLGSTGQLGISGVGSRGHDAWNTSQPTWMANGAFSFSGGGQQLPIPSTTATYDTMNGATNGNLQDGSSIPTTMEQHASEYATAPDYTRAAQQYNYPNQTSLGQIPTSSASMSSLESLNQHPSFPGYRAAGYSEAMPNIPITPTRAASDYYKSNGAVQYASVSATNQGAMISPPYSTAGGDDRGMAAMYPGPYHQHQRSDSSGWGSHENPYYQANQVYNGS